MRIFGCAAGLLLYLCALAAVCRSCPEPMLVNWLLRVREVRRDAKANQRCKPAPALAVNVYSQLTVGEDGTVTGLTAIDCDGHTERSTSSSWPNPGNPQDIIASKLSESQMAELMSFLNTQEVKDIHDFMNAAPIFDNYTIEIARHEHPQIIKVIGFMPGHVELQQHPALTQLICRFKEIARAASKSGEVPDWCKANSLSK